MDPEEIRALRDMLGQRYDWHKIAARTVEVYRRVHGPGAG